MFVWTLVLTLGSVQFLSVFMDSCACPCVSQCFYALLYSHRAPLFFSVFVLTFLLTFEDRLRFPAFVLTLVLARVFLSVQVCTLVLVATFLSVFMDPCACPCVLA